MARARKPKGAAAQRAEQDFDAGVAGVRKHPLFAPLLGAVWIRRSAVCPHDGWVVAEQSGSLYCHPTRHATAAEWEFVIACALLHYALDHFRDRDDPIRWQAAAELAAVRFARDVGIGRPPQGFAYPPNPPGRDARELELRLPAGIGRPVGFPPALSGSGPGLVLDGPARGYFGANTNWEALFAEGLRAAVTGAIEVAGGVRRELGDSASHDSMFVQARDWFVSSYPLLGALARHFEIIDDPDVCSRLDITVAAVDETAEEIYVNRGAGLDLDEARFVLAHELLHVGLRHLDRRAGRDPFLWNVACDYVINGWLIEMRIGTPPRLGLLHDPELAGQSAESIYDRIAADLRLQRRLTTLRGRGLGDMLERGDRMPKRGSFTDLDAFYRSCLARGLELHEAEGRGLLPAGLVEEIRALQQPPIPWDVQLAQWFEEWYPTLEARRTYARPSRRQASTPDIPRPRYLLPQELRDARTFGVVLDTSGSMDRQLLGKALGAIASYAARHDVPAARVVFCDAAAYDAGYIPPAEIAGRVAIRGRGGTVLQPGIDLLERTKDFPKDGPILVITDGDCDLLRVKRGHAFLLPRGRRLPFGTKAPVFFLD